MMFDTILFILGMIITVLLGFKVRSLLDYFTKYLVSSPPKKFAEKDWEDLIGQGDKRSAGNWIGLFERILFLIGLQLNLSGLIFAWMAFKVAAKWNAWNTIIKLDEELPKINEIEYLKARRNWGTYAYQREALGTIMNLLIALLAMGLIVVADAYRFQITRYLAECF